MTSEQNHQCGWIVAVDNDARPSVCPLIGDSMTIGRAPWCTICVPAPTVSRSHALLVRAGALVLIADQASLNGTYVNGRRLSGPCILADEDLISLGVAGPMFQFLARPWPWPAEGARLNPLET